LFGNSLAKIMCDLEYVNWPLRVSSVSFVFA